MKREDKRSEMKKIVITTKTNAPKVRKKEEERK